MTIRTYLVVTSLEGQHKRGGSPVPLTRKAKGLSGGRHFWMTGIVEREKEARYCDIRQDEKRGWRDKRTSLGKYKSKTQDAD